MMTDLTRIEECARKMSINGRWIMCVSVAQSKSSPASTVIHPDSAYLISKGLRLLV